MRLGVDIGGTFTDMVLADETGVVASGKVLTVPDDPVRAIVEGIRNLGAEGWGVSEIVDTVHGTTLVTNAVIEGKGAKTALIVTKGFRDLLEIGREWRYDIYDIGLDPPPHLVQRPLRFEVAERSLASGKIALPLQPGEMARVAKEIPADVKAVAICFLHSYANPDNERQARDELLKLRPDLEITLSSDVAPEVREFERMSTAVVNAYVQPLVRPYLSELEQRLRDEKVQSHLYVFLSNGGLVTANDASRFPVRIVESGPAAGATAAANLSGRLGAEHVVALDMGGTTAKICFIEGGRPLVAHEFEVARTYRFKPGSGIPLKVPSVELLEIGAGGGSIARIDDLGLLQVGPHSAGAAPGPVSYGRGGTLPTVTDADLILGYLNGDNFLGGRMKLDRASAERVVEETIAKPSKRSLTEAAWGIHRVVNENMANAMRVHAAERGKDVRSYALLASGGAAGVHACRVAEAMRISRVICPAGASVFSAVGMLMAPLAFDFVRTARFAVANVDWERVRKLYDEMRTEGLAMMKASGVAQASVTMHASCEMRFVGQGYELKVPIPLDGLGPEAVDEITSTFSDLYRKLYGRLPAHVELEALNWRLSVSGPTPVMAARTDVATNGDAKPRSRKVFFPETGVTDTPVYDRAALKPGTRIEGPAIFEESDTTVIALPNWSATVDAEHNLQLALNN